MIIIGNNNCSIKEKGSKLERFQAPGLFFNKIEPNHFTKTFKNPKLVNV